MRAAFPDILNTLATGTRRNTLRGLFCTICHIGLKTSPLRRRVWTEDPRS